MNAENLSRDSELFALWSKMSGFEQEQFIRSFPFTDEERNAFLLHMTFMRMFNDVEYYSAMKQVLSKHFYEYFNRKEA